MKEFEFFVNKKVVKRQKADFNLARASINEGLDRLSLAKNIFLTQKPKYVLENSYEAIRELIDAILYSEGYKSYSHEATIAYLLKLGFSISEVNMIDKLRQKRNSIKYYGGDSTKEEAEESLKIAKEVITKLLEKASLKGLR